MKYIKRLALLVCLSTTLAACNSSPPLATAEKLSGNWFVGTIQDKAIMAKSTVKLQFDADNKLTGSASCNNLFTSYSSQKDTISIAPIATTRKMCLPALMDQESRLLQSLSKVKRFQLNDGQLLMFDQEGSLQLMAKRTQ